jgi:hypothetical protein
MFLRTRRPFLEENESFALQSVHNRVCIQTCGRACNEGKWTGTMDIDFADRYGDVVGVPQRDARCAGPDSTLWTDPRALPSLRREAARLCRDECPVFSACLSYCAGPVTWMGVVVAGHVFRGSVPATHPSSLYEYVSAPGGTPSVRPRAQTASDSESAA